MTEAEAIARYGLPPAMTALPEIRILPAAETERCRTHAGDGPLLRPYCLMLFSLGYLTDALPIWRAKQSNFDAACGIEIQIVCGGGYRETKTFLSKCPEPDAAAAKVYLDECSADCKAWTPAGHLSHWQQYYGLA